MCSDIVQFWTTLAVTPLVRNRGVLRANLATLAAWVRREAGISWVRPMGGAVILLRYDAGIGSTGARRGAPPHA